MVNRTPPEEWPLDREPELIDEKYASSDRDEAPQSRGEELLSRLGEDGYRLLTGIGFVHEFLLESDMTPEEAIKCLEYEIEDYKDES